MTLQERALSLCARITAIHEKATKGEWEEDGLRVTVSKRGIVAAPMPNAYGTFDCAANARAIALDHNLAPAMIEIVKGLASFQTGEWLWIDDALVSWCESAEAALKGVEG